jgi:hypothetical protein
LTRLGGDEGSEHGGGGEVRKGEEQHDEEVEDCRRGRRPKFGLKMLSTEKGSTGFAGFAEKGPKGPPAAGGGLPRNERSRWTGEKADDVSGSREAGAGDSRRKGRNRVAAALTSSSSPAFDPGNLPPALPWPASPWPRSKWIMASKVFRNTGRHSVLGPAKMSSVKIN